MIIDVKPTVAAGFVVHAGCVQRSILTRDIIMFDISWGRSSRNCAGVSRRDALKVGALAAGGLTMADLLRAESLAAEAGRDVKRKAVICFWLDGGPTNHETWDPKPEAPSEYRGPFDAIQTSVPGIELCELFPRTAQVMDKLSVIRSVYHNNGDHFAAAHWMWTGYHGSSAARLEAMYPSVGSIISKTRGANQPGMPAFVSVPQAMTVGRRPGYQGSAFMGVAYNPFDVGADPNSSRFRVQNVNLPNGVTVDRTMDRQSLISGLDRFRRDTDTGGLMEGMDTFNQRAFDMITGERARKAFDINREDPRTRDRYGRTGTGQGTLLARRLVEAGVSFVTVHAGGWDNHSGIEAAMKRHATYLDPAISSLVSDLDQRGMMDDVIVMVMGEFGRTPRVNGGAGRDHWGNLMSVLIGGGGLQSGIVVGESDDKGTRPIKRAVRPAHVLHTIYRQMGVDPGIAHINHAGRPIPILSDGEPIRELL
jgi:uncharacterized protein (DUF1501 family)